MADLRSRNENAELKQRIHFLTNLINNAKHQETQQIPWKRKASSFSSIKPSSSWDKESHCVQPSKIYTKPDYNSSKLSKPIPPGRPLFDKKYALSRTRKSPIGTVSINSTHIVKKVIPSIEPVPSCSGGSKVNVISSNDLSPLPNPSSSLNLDKHSLASLKKLLAAKLEAKQCRKNETKASKDASKKLTHSATTKVTKQANKASEQHLSNRCLPNRQKHPCLTVDSPTSTSAMISVPRKDSDIKKPHSEPQIADQPTVNDVLPTKGDLAKNLQSTEAKIKELTAELTKLKEVAKIVTSSPQKDSIPKQKRHSGASKSSLFQHHKRRTSSNASNSRFTSANIKRFNHSNTQHAAKYVVSKYKIRKVPNKKNSLSKSKLLKPKSPFPRKTFSPRTFHRHSTKSGPYSWSSQNSLHSSWSASRLQKTKYPFRRPPKYASHHGAFVNYRSRYNMDGMNQSLGVWRRNFLARRHSVWQSQKSYHHKSKHIYTREGLSTHRKTSRAQKDFAVTRSKTISVRGVKFQLGSTGKTLKRIEYPASPSKGKSACRSVTRVDYRGVTYVETKPGTLEKLSSSQSRWRASQSVHRSIAVTRFSKKKSARQYCMFYCRFGKCNRGDKCQYIHDPEKVAVCTRFLRGTCKIENCAFSHKVSKDKMPVCSYFLRGRCVRENCPYLHVNVGESAKVCRDFLKGFCPRGEKCTEKHILRCPEFVRTGRCTAGRECRLEHRTARKRKTPTTDATKQDNSLEQTVSESVVETPSERASVSRREGVEEEVPFKLRKLPAFISISTSDDPEPPAITNSSSPSKLPKEPLRIKPRL